MDHASVPGPSEQVAVRAPAPAQSLSALGHSNATNAAGTRHLLIWRRLVAHPSRCAEARGVGATTSPLVRWLWLFEDLDTWIRMRLRRKLRKRFKSKMGIDHHRFRNRMFDDRGLFRLEHLVRRTHQLSPV